MKLLLTYYVAIIVTLAIVYLFFRQDYSLAGVVTFLLLQNGQILLGATYIIFSNITDIAAVLA